MDIGVIVALSGLGLAALLAVLMGSSPAALLYSYRGLRIFAKGHY